MLRRLILVALLGAAGTAVPSMTSAHSGGLNAEGCHNNRKTGDYHCHRGARGTTNLRPKADSPGGAFRNCAEARSVGAAPVRRGDLGYGSHLDRDGDGIGCE